MEDRFKYKVWDKKRREFYKGPPSLAFNKGKLTIVSQDREDLTILQCTGMRDIQGNLIYEGDILNITESIGLVIWLDGGWALIGPDFYGNALFPQIRSIPGVDGEESRALWGKIIGNRFEDNFRIDEG